ncbi:MAG: sigma 54-interacting transcriptional regulator [Spirochaetia bacterium]|nr:sigma 54-interacting transcriptional regulator [Spirochaetia bacterium]
MYCENCGTKAEEGSKFCGKCGRQWKDISRLKAEIEDGLKSRRPDGLAEKIKAIEEETGKEDFMKLKGDLAFVKGNYRESYEDYSGIPSVARPWDVLFNMALIDISVNRQEQAVKNLETLISADVDPSKSVLYSEKYKSKKNFFADVYLYLGVLHKNLGLSTEALKFFEKALQFNPDSDLANANLGDIYFKQDNYDTAISCYKRAAECAADDIKKSHIQNDLGLAYFRKGLIEEAVSSFKSAIFLNSDNSNAVYNLGLIYVKSGMQDAVKDDYKEFLKHESGLDIVFNLSRSIMDAAKQESMMDIGVEFIGTDESVKNVKSVILKAAATDSTVLITGENGTGKELAARAIHQMSKRSDRPFIVVNCGALPETLLESELFGHEKGAFTGAVREKPGRFELADRGSVFLDEIGDITPAMQVKLLRFVQQREFERVGGTQLLKVDVRIIAATNRDLKKMVEQGKFREDLYYRLYVLPVMLPPLRARGRDVLLLAEHFLRNFSEKNRKVFTSISERAQEAFLSYSWPGNVRELENVIERVVSLNDGPVVELDNLPDEITAGRFNDEKTVKEYGEKEVILKVLEDTKYSKTKAAKALGISRVALWKKMKKLGMQ